MKSLLIAFILLIAVYGCKKDSQIPPVEEPKEYPLADTWWKLISNDQFGTADSMRIIMFSGASHTANEYTNSNGLVDGEWWWESDSTEIKFNVNYQYATVSKTYEIYYFDHKLLIMGYFGATYVFEPY